MRQRGMPIHMPSWAAGKLNCAIHSVTGCSTCTKKLQPQLCTILEFGTSNICFSKFSLSFRRKIQVAESRVWRNRARNRSICKGQSGCQRCDRDTIVTLFTSPLVSRQTYHPLLLIPLFTRKLPPLVKINIDRQYHLESNIEYPQK